MVDAFWEITFLDHKVEKRDDPVSSIVLVPRFSSQFVEICVDFRGSNNRNFSRKRFHECANESFDVSQMVDANSAASQILDVSFVSHGGFRASDDALAMGVKKVHGLLQ